MKYAIISDIHANPAALERVLADAERCGTEKVVCAGDVVGIPWARYASCANGGYQPLWATMMQPFLVGTTRTA